MHLRFGLLLLLAGSIAVLAGEPAAPDYGLNEPVVLVDRFSDAAGTLLRRSLDPSLPAPNAPIDFDAAPFRVRITLPDGSERACYNLDLGTLGPLPRMYFFYDTGGHYVLTQFPVIDRLPGQPGYSDVWDVWKVFVPLTFRQENQVRDFKAIEALLANPEAGARAERTGILINGPVVPQGSTASLKADNREGSAALRWAWYRGQRVPFLYFEGSIKAPVESTPMSSMTVDSLAALTGKGTPPRARFAPGSPNYSPLQMLVDASGNPLVERPLNCPIVGAALP